VWYILWILKRAIHQKKCNPQKIEQYAAKRMQHATKKRVIQCKRAMQSIREGSATKQQSECHAMAQCKDRDQCTAEKG